MKIIAKKRDSEFTFYFILFSAISFILFILTLIPN